MIRVLMFCTVLMCFISCTAAQPVKKTDADFAKAMEESEKSSNKKLDFLADEKLPNDEFTPADTLNTVNMPVDYKEIVPTAYAKYRIQVFAGSPENAYKNYKQLSSVPENKEVYMIRDTDGKWKVWTGAYATHEEADRAKTKLIQSGYPDAWINEMKGKYAPAGPAFYVQIGSFQNEASAQKAKTEAEERLKEKANVERVDQTWKVWIGGYTERAQADELKKKIQAQYPKAFIVRYGE